MNLAKCRPHCPLGRTFRPSSPYRCQSTHTPELRFRSVLTEDGARRIELNQRRNNMMRRWESGGLEPVGTSDHARGPKDAPVTLVKYGDYECPYCGEAHPVLKELQERV